MGVGRQPKPECTGGISYKTLGLTVGSAAIGSAGTLLVFRISAGGAETFSMAGLLGFFAVAFLAGAAITLSVAAVSLCRKAELSLQDRSAELAAAQVQTGEATRQMEQRMNRLGRQLKDSMDSEFNRIRKEMRDELTSPQVSNSPERPPVEKNEPDPSDAVNLADKKYSDFKDIVLLGVANYPGVASEKIGEGHYRTEGDELVDGAFVLNSERVAVCAFATGDLLIDRFTGSQGDSFSGFLYSMLTELKKGNFSRVFLVFDSVLNNSSPYAKALNEFSGRVAADTFTRFELFEGSPGVVIPELTERASQLMVQDLDEAAG